MSGRIIMGMEMPASCHVCVAGFGGLCYFGPSWDECECPDNGRPDWCPLVPVPPHGRLIAEDDAIETAWMILSGLGYHKDENPELDQAVRDVFSTAPAIEVE